ncbi:polyprenol reductase [Prorops nasuta]|uniref:polyprenol reductase n=1 Tax=Prorops nasuta TaxID=863751 RepID=UPI0034CD616E
MNLLHYIFGILHYFGILIAVIGETHSFTKGSHMPLNWRNLTIYHYLLAAIFFWVGIEQHKANLILRNLRKDKTGRFMNSGYAIPTGQLYNYISSPLQFLEILVYMILSLILWQANSFHFITIWVIANQITCCWMNQEWYTNTFSNYPKERKILIPFIY